MEKEHQPVETRFKDLSGHINVNLTDGTEFARVISDLTGFNPDRFDPIAVRFYYENAMQLTVYAVDRSKQETWNKTDKLPVHKFKVEVDLARILPFIAQVNFTVSTGVYNLEDMEVINK
jgi:hypothetical protein